MFGNKTTPTQKSIGTLIGAGTVIEGTITYTGGLRIDGAVTGPVHVSQLLELQPKARITGDVHYHSLEIHQGAVVEGRLIYAAAGGEGRPALKLAAGGTTSET